MPKVQANGIELFYEELGDTSAPPVLLVMGYSVQLLGWDARFVRLLADKGFRVIRFDNRDVGLSTHLDGVDSHLQEALAGDASRVPYRLSDMARDVVGLMDALCFDAAHVVGASMGGMIAQVLAIEHPRRVLSLPRALPASSPPSSGARTAPRRCAP